MLLSGTLGPSIRSSVSAARQAAQAVRPSLPTELYEQVNALHWRVQETTWQPPVKRVDLLVQLGGQRRANRLRSLPSGADAGADRRPERPADEHLDDLVAGACAATRPSRQPHEPNPEVRPRLIGAVQRQRDVHAQDPCEVVRPLEVTAQQGQ